MIELSPINTLFMAGIFAAVIITFIICIRRELK